MSAGRIIDYCRSCRTAIVFNQTKAGKFTPVNVVDGKPHWQTCTDPKAHRRPPRPAAKHPPDAGAAQRRLL